MKRLTRLSAQRVGGFSTVEGNRAARSFLLFNQHILSLHSDTTLLEGKEDVGMGEASKLINQPRNYSFHRRPRADPQSKSKTKGNLKSKEDNSKSTSASNSGACGSSSAAGAPKPVLQRLKTKLFHIRDFFTSYFEGLVLFKEQMVIASRLVKRVYFQGERYSRREKALMRQSAEDMVKVLPITSMVLLFGIELSSAAILRYIPGLMPSSIRSKVEPKAHQLGISSADTLQQEKTEEAVTKLSEMTKEFAQMTMASDAAAAEYMPEIVKFIEQLDEPETRLNTVDILRIAPAFRRYMAMEKLPKEQLLQLAELHIPNYAYKMIPAFLIARQLRSYVQKLRADDKEIHWEGLISLSDEEVVKACKDRGLISTFNFLDDDSDVDLLRYRLRSWLALSLNREVPSSLLLLSCAFIRRDDDLLEAKYGVSGVKLQVLQSQALEYESLIEQLTKKLADVKLDIENYQQINQANVSTEHLGITKSTELLIKKSHSLVDSEHDRVQDMVLGLRSREAVHVRKAFLAAHEPDDDIYAPISFDRVEDVMLPLLATGLKKDVDNPQTRMEIANLLPWFDHDNDEQLDYIDFVHLYEELRIREDEKSDQMKQREALQRLAVLLDTTEETTEETTTTTATTTTEESGRRPT